MPYSSRPVPRNLGYSGRMAPKLFSRADLGALVNALGNNQDITNSALDTLWTTYGRGKEPAATSKEARANNLIRAISEQPNADSRLLELINETFYFSHFAELRRQDPSFKRFYIRVQQRMLNDGRFLLDPEDGLVVAKAYKESVSSSAQTQTRSDEEEVRATDMAQNSDPRAVFIVHGRNIPLKDELVRFLTHIDVRPISWTEAAQATHKTMPFTLEIVRAGMRAARAVIVIFSPDDEARLRPQFHKEHDGAQERTLTGQARQNVLLEAGMAMALSPDRTIFVRVGRPREVSDIQGINWIDLDDGWDSRTRLLHELQAAGVQAASNRNLTDRLAGRFESVAF